MNATVRAAAHGDLGGVVDTLTVSFLDDPVMRWAFPDARTRPRRLTTLWSYVAEGVYLPHGGCTTIEDHRAVALWRPAGAPDSSEFWAANGERFVIEMEGEVERTGELTALMSAHHPDHVDHWYLLAIGVAPEWQGRGLGGLLLEHTLDHLDRVGLPAYLEATSDRSRRLYRRHGFVDTAEFAPDGGPPIWGMWRDPNPSRS